MDTAVADPGYASNSSGRQISFLPISLFGAASSLGSLSIDWRLAAPLFGVPTWISSFFIAATVVTFVLLSLAYLAKFIAYPSTVREEFEHPVIGSLFGLIPLSLLSISGALAALAPRIAVASWIAGAAAMILFTWFMVVRWISSQQQAEMAHPAWIVAAGGILNVPLAVPALNLTGLEEVSILLLAVGLFLTIPIFTLILNRLLFEAPLAKPLRPALMILTAPFAIAYSAYISVTGDHDFFAHSLFMLDVFLTAVCLPLLVHLPVCCPFRISWWSVSFPLAASTGAALRFAGHASGRFGFVTAAIFLTLSTAVILWLLCRTIFGLAKHELETLNK